MSCNYKRQEVRSVSSSVLPIAAGGIILAAGLVTTILRSLSSGAREAYRINSSNMPVTKPDVIKPLAALQGRWNIVQNRRCVLSPVEAVKVSALLNISHSGYLVENTVPVRQKLQALQVASTQEEAQIAQKSLMKELEVGHQRIFVKGLTLACKKASVKAGFASIEAQAASNGLVRVVASDSYGRALVTEIDGGTGRNPRIVTEVVGIHDGSCKQIMETFDKALEEQGVKSSPPKRKFTGGVCETSAALEFVRRNVTRVQTPYIRTEKKQNYSGVRRIQTLNQRNYIRQKA
jgi:hypothetical protein